MPALMQEQQGLLRSLLGQQGKKVPEATTLSTSPVPFPPPPHSCGVFYF